MPKTPTAPPSDPPPTDQDTPEHLPPNRVVGQNVLAALGRPPGLYDVFVRPLWGNHYRVNVRVGPDATAVRVAHSFFVAAGATGTILSAAPPITRTYG